MNLELLEEAAGIVARNLFQIRYSDKSIDGPEMQECIADTVFVINNFMRVSADLAEKAAAEENGDSNS